MLTDAEINVFKKGLDFEQIQLKINEARPRRVFNEFCTRMCLKWHFWNEPQKLDGTAAFTPKSTWHSPKGYACQENFLSQIEDLFETPISDLQHANISTEEWQTVRFLASEKQIGVLA